MKKAGIILMIITGIMLILDAIMGIMISYQYNLKIGSYWELADKASTIQQKSDNINILVNILEQSGLQSSYDALFLKTPNNSFNENLNALKSLQRRMNDIKTMDISSFEYQTAIQQITQQEQGEAQEMLGVLKGCWIKDNCIFFWHWVCAAQVMLLIILFLLGVGLYINDDE